MPIVWYHLDNVELSFRPEQPHKGSYMLGGIVWSGLTKGSSNGTIQHYWELEQDNFNNLR